MADHPLRERIDELNKRKEQALQPGSDRNVERQRNRGKMLARERIDYLLDEGSFHELDMADIAGDPHYAARGTIVDVDGTPMQGLVARLSKTPGRIRWTGRPLGADQVDVLGT